MVELTIVEKEGDVIGISTATAGKIGVTEDQILIITNQFTNRRTVGRVKISGTAPDDTIEVDRVSIEAIGVDTGFDVDAQVFHGEPVNIDEIDFGIETLQHSDEVVDSLITIKNNEEAFIDFLKNRPFTKESRFNWEEQNLVISIKSTVPPLQPGDIASFESLRNFSYGWAGSELKTFDGLLLLDMSGSMDTQDMLVQDVGWAIDQMRNELTHEMSVEFLNRFSEGQRVRRYEGAALCSLLYLVEKIGRGVGDNIAILPFSDRVHQISFGGSSYYNSNMGQSNHAAESIIDKVEEMHHGLTNLAPALEIAIETSKMFDWRKMKMIVLLTDGKADDEEEVLRIIEERIAPRSDIVLNTLGLGTRVNTKFLIKIANMTGGMYHTVYGLRELTSIYGKYALDLSIKGSDRRKMVAGGATGHMSCPGCKKQMKFIENYSSWYCYDCKKYRQDFQKKIEQDSSMLCPKCGQPSSHISEYDRWYCYGCQAYL